MLYEDAIVAEEKKIIWICGEEKRLRLVVAMNEAKGTLFI